MIPVRSSVRSAGIPWGTAALILINVACFVGELSLKPEQLDALIAAWGVVPLRQASLLRSHPWALQQWLLPVFSSMFLHGGWAHLAGNMGYLWVFGGGVEGRLGLKRFVFWYLLCGTVAAQAQVLMNPLSAAPMVGASGAIAGVLGGYFVLYPRSTVLLAVPWCVMISFFEVPAIAFLLIWFVEQLALGTVFSLSKVAGEAGGIAWWAHVGGFAAGIVMLGPFLLGAKRRRVLVETRRVRR